MMPGSGKVAIQQFDDPMSLGACLQGVLACPQSFAENRVTGLAMDTRQMQGGEIFVALSGISQHGVDFLAAALDKQPSAVIVECENGKPNIQFLPETFLAKAKRFNVALLSFDTATTDKKTLLVTLADRVFDAPSRHCHVIGITGTNGKTSCAHYLAQAIASVSASADKAALIGTLGNGLFGQLQHASHTTPDMFSVHRMMRDYCEQGATHVVMEVSSHGLDQGRVDGVHFETALFTNLTQDHLDYHQSMQAYGDAKKQLFLREGLELAIINGDDDFAPELLSAIADNVDVIVYGCSQPRSDRNYVWAKSISLKHDGIEMQIESFAGDFTLSCQLMGRFNVSNVLAVCAYLLHNGSSIDRVQDAVAQLRAVDGRMQRVARSDTPVTALVDYAHTPDALEKAITAAKEHLHGDDQGSASSGDLCVVFGCGGDRDAGKRPLMGRVAAAAADRIILTDDNPRSESAQAIIEDIKAGMAGHGNWLVIHDRQQAIAKAINEARAGDVILIAGKGHENYQIVGKEKRPTACDAELAQAALAKWNNSAATRGGRS